LSEQQGRVSTGSKAPVTGLNDDLEFMGKRLHVQTEHMELPVAHIVTQVFSNGRVLMSKKRECPAGIQASQDIGGVQRLMSAQHYQVLQEIAAKQAKILSSR
jgi:hypothetical protein